MQQQVPKARTVNGEAVRHDADAQRNISDKPAMPSTLTRGTGYPRGPTFTVSPLSCKCQVLCVYSLQVAACLFRWSGRIEASQHNLHTKACFGSKDQALLVGPIGHWNKLPPLFVVYKLCSKVQQLGDKVLFVTGYQIWLHEPPSQVMSATPLYTPLTQTLFGEMTGLQHFKSIDFYKEACMAVIQVSRYCHFSCSTHPAQCKPIAGDISSQSNLVKYIMKSF